MLEENNKRDKAQLICLIGMRSNDTPSFALLIGAGTSVSSGVKAGSEMIKDWRQQLYDQSSSSEPLDKWLSKQDWYEDDEEYSILFEMVCDQRSQRRIYIENCVKEARPSWGYIYLANIIANKYFNVIFTPNFDDLLNEACFLYTDQRPIVCAHDSAVADIRVTSTRPKIIKLHGDYLYDSIKNTVVETQTLEKNMRDKFMQFANEYGLVVIGYGGNDGSIMDTVDMLLKSEGHLQNGLYWCRRREDKVSKRLDRIMRRENAYWVDIESFDDFMAELHHGLGLSLPDAVSDPYKATTERLNTFIFPSDEVKHDIIKKDMEELGEKVAIFERAISGQIASQEFDRLVPYRFLGDREYNRKDYKAALQYYEKAMVQEPTNINIMEKVILSYNATEQYELSLDKSEEIINCAPNDARGYLWKGNSLSVLRRLDDALLAFNEALKIASPKSRIRSDILTMRSNTKLIASDWYAALSDAEKALELDAENKAALINKCTALKNLNRKEEAEAILKDELSEINNNYLLACAFSILDDKKNMLIKLKTAVKEDMANKADAKSDPDFAEYRDDHAFRNIVYNE